MNKVYFPSLNGLRFFAALSVMIYHFYGLEVLNGHLGVVLFFVLSGFLITYLLFEEKEKLGTVNIRSFYLRRILRIWPLYFFIILIASVVFLTNNSLENYLSTIPYFIFFLPNLAFVFELPIKYAEVLWSVGSEEQFYGFWPWIFRIKLKRRILLIFFTVIALFALTPHFLDYAHANYYSNNKLFYYTSHLIQRMNFGSMAIGSVLAYMARYDMERIKFLFNPYLQWLNFILLLMCWVKDFHFFFNDQAYALMFGILILNLALNEKPIFSLENELFNFLGKISFGLYVYHLISMDVLSIINTGIENTIPKHFEFLLMLCLTIIFSYLSHELIETPFLRMKKGYTVIKSGDRD